MYLACQEHDKFAAHCNFTKISKLPIQLPVENECLLRRAEANSVQLRDRIHGDHPRRLCQIVLNAFHKAGLRRKAIRKEQKYPFAYGIGVFSCQLREPLMSERVISVDIENL